MNSSANFRITVASQDDWKISRRSGRENRSTTSSFGMHLLKATKLTLTGHRPPSNYYGEKPFATLTSGWQRLRSRGSPATLNKTFSTRLRHRRIGGGEATFPFSKTAARPGVDFVQFIPPNTIPRSVIQKIRRSLAPRKPAEHLGHDCCHKER
jgi:hypothetical protein